MKGITEIKDPIFGLISLKKDEKEIIDKPLFQRLRFIKQLALCYIVYPGANHTRFEHSVGTMHLSGLMAEKLGLNVERARLCGLLHDIGHVAFSHSGEKVLKDLAIAKNHEEFGKIFLEEILKDTSYSAKEILKCKENYLVSFSIGSDRLDYLRRDAYYCGVPFGYIDYEHLLANFEIKGKKIIIKESALSTVETLFIGRYLMFFSVYLHRTVRIATAMLDKALRISLKNNIITLDDLIWKGDNYCLQKMASEVPLAKAILERKLFKIVDKIDKKKECFIIKPGKVKKRENEILIKTRDGEIKKLSELSPLVNSLSHSISKRNKTIKACKKE